MCQNFNLKMLKNGKNWHVPTSMDGCGRNTIIGIFQFIHYFYKTQLKTPNFWPNFAKNSALAG